MPTQCYGEDTVMNNTGVVSSFRVYNLVEETVHLEMVMSVLSAMIGSVGCICSHLRNTYPCIKGMDQRRLSGGSDV